MEMIIRDDIQAVDTQEFSRMFRRRSWFIALPQAYISGGRKSEGASRLPASRRNVLRHIGGDVRKAAELLYANAKDRQR